MQKLKDLASLVVRARHSEYTADVVDAENEIISQDWYENILDIAEFVHGLQQNISAVCNDRDSWQQRAEAAEEANKEYASLADSWEAHARRATAERDELQEKLKDQDELIHSLQETVYRYSGPAPAINLADLVPDDENGSPQGFVAWYERHFALQPYKGASHVSDCEDSWRAAILRNIEEAHQKRQQNIPEIIPGWKLVPVEPPAAMIDAVVNVVMKERCEAMTGGKNVTVPRDCIMAALAAAPEVK